MNDYMLFRMRRAELIGKAEQARLARQARDPAGASARPARKLVLAGARCWRWRSRAAGTGQASRRPGTWQSMNAANE